MSKQVVIIGGGLSAKHCAETLMKKGKKVKDIEVTIIQANKFVEWPLAMTVCLVRPDLHDKALASDCAKFEIKGVKYKYAVAAGIDAKKKRVLFNKPDGELSDDTVRYDCLIVATGFSAPLVYPRTSMSIEERKKEVQGVGNALKNANKVVIAGGGPIGIELVGDIRAEYPDKHILLVSRNGILPKWPEKYRQKIEAQLKNMKIEVKSGNFDAPTDFSFEAGQFTFGSVECKYDVFLPAFSQGPNTKFLESAEVLDASGYIDVNENLQARACKEIFAVGVSNLDEIVAMPKLEGQWNSVATNVIAMLQNKPLKPHKEGAPWMKLPPMILIGHGPKGYGYIDFNNVPPPIKCCCCNGYGGWPCCPPPCCACCGCGCCCYPCGYCFKAPEGKGPAMFGGTMAFKSAGFHFKGVGDAPAQQKMK